MKTEIIEKCRLLLESAKQASDPESDTAVALHECKLPGIGMVPVLSVIHNSASNMANIYPVAVILDNEDCAALEGVTKLKNLTFLNREEKEDTIEGS